MEGYWTEFQAKDVFLAYEHLTADEYDAVCERCGLEAVGGDDLVHDWVKKATNTITVKARDSSEGFPVTYPYSVVN